jgi:hypothetical protein
MRCRFMGYLTCFCVLIVQRKTHHYSELVTIAVRL